MYDTQGVLNTEECTNAKETKSHQKLIDAHASIYGNFTAEVTLKLLLLHCIRSIVRQQLR